jgi:DNA-binding transcriptional LysR family regulator
VIELKRLPALPLITFPRGNSTRELLDKRFAEIDTLVAPRYEVAFLWTAIALVNVGLGYAVVPAQVSGLKGIFPRVVFFRLTGFEERREICLLTHVHRSLSPAAEQFRIFAREHLPKFDSYKTLTPSA